MQYYYDDYYAAEGAADPLAAGTWQQENSTYQYTPVKVSVNIGGEGETDSSYYDDEDYR
jgi:hypothetical protein